MRFISKIFVIVSILFTGITAQQAKKNLLDNFFKKDSVVILVTDSGLGGLSIAADLFEQLKTTCLFRKADIIFFNAQPHISYGYNQMESTEEKVWVFENALNEFEKNLKPDLILIGCNTLSVIYEYTDFSKSASIPVIGIVETGVDLIKQNMDKFDNSKVIIFATETTVGEAKHRNNLVSLGIDEDRIIAVPCPRLAGSIERDSESRFTDSLVTAYVNESLNHLNKNDKIFVSYNCTHYGYIDNLFRNRFNDAGVHIENFLNPNPYMLKFLFEDSTRKQHANPDISIRVISQAELTPDKIGSIYLLIEKSSSESADALLYYDYQPDFFNWKYTANKE